MEEEDKTSQGSMIQMLAMTFALLFAGCTQTITLTHTQGYADDIVDTTSTASPDVKPNVQIPALPL